MVFRALFGVSNRPFRSERTLGTLHNSNGEIYGYPLILCIILDENEVLSCHFVGSIQFQSRGGWRRETAGFENLLFWITNLVDLVWIHKQYSNGFIWFMWEMLSLFVLSQCKAKNDIIIENDKIWRKDSEHVQKWANLEGARACEKINKAIVGKPRISSVTLPDLKGIDTLSFSLYTNVRASEVPPPLCLGIKNSVFVYYLMIKSCCA